MSERLERLGEGGGVDVAVSVLGEVVDGPVGGDVRDLLKVARRQVDAVDVDAAAEAAGDVKEVVVALAAE